MAMNMAAAKRNDPVQVNVRLSQERADELDAWIDEINAKRSWPRTTRSDVLRILLERALEEKPDLIR